MKKLFSLVLVVMMMMALAVPAFADGETTPIPRVESGSITINGVSDHNVYSIYRILILESYDETKGAYSYKIADGWADFFTYAATLSFVAIDEAGYVTWTAAEDDDTVASFAKEALAYAKSKDISPNKTSAKAGEFVITVNAETGKNLGTFSDLPLGYYLIDSTMGALCGLTTTNPNASINAKNGSPTIDKQVKEDSTGNWGSSNTADIGQIIEFRTTINVHAGAQNYVLHDKMGPGLEFIGVSSIEHVVPGVDTHVVETNLYTVSEGTETSGEKCTFEVTFSEELCEELETNDKLIVYYSAKLTKDAIISDANKNESWLNYGEGYTTESDSTDSFTYGIDIVKTDSQNKLIDGAEFRIYDALTGGNEISVVKIDDGKYRRAVEGEEAVSIVVTNGIVEVVGLDNGTYYLEETVAPSGYNKLTARQKFIISDASLDAIFNGDVFSTGSGVHVVNKTGSMLPETGGLGTTLFVTFGGIMVLGAGVVLFAKKRLSQIEE